MIPVPFPNMVLNAHNSPGQDYEMLHTCKVPRSTSVTHLVSQIETAALTTQSMWGIGLETVIFNAHGSPGKIKIGHHITLKDVTKFSRLQGLVKRIWIIACEVAMVKEAGTVKDGNYFCYRLAQESGAYVKASSVVQIGYPDLYAVDLLPPGYIDDWEPPVYRWNPDGERY